MSEINPKANLDEDQRSKRQKWSGMALVPASLVGCGLALYAAYQTILLRWQGLVNPSACSVNDWINCDAVLASSHAFLLNIPVAWWGALYYLCVLALAIWLIVKPSKQLSLLGLGLTTAGLLFSLYKAFYLFVVLKLFCPVCVLMYLVNIALLILIWGTTGVPRRALFKFSETPPEKSNLSLLRIVGLGFILFTGIFASGYLLACHLESRYFKLPEVNVAGEVEKHFEQPPQEIRVAPEAATWGNSAAKVTIVEFSDFQCSHCRRSAALMKGLLWEFRDQVKFVFMNFPLDPKINRFIHVKVHEHAGLAARAAVCAQKRGKFWEFHDALFQIQNHLSAGAVLALAESFGWDRLAFERDLNDQATYARVRLEIEYAGPSIRSTPSLFINGRKVDKWRHPGIIQEIIRQELGRVRGS